MLEGWVDVHLPDCGHKRMKAYFVVARMFDCHESLIRRVLGRQVEKLDADFYKQVMLSKPKLRARREARARADLARYAPRDRAPPPCRGEAPDAP